ncbi:THUMP domain-containing protein 1 isoform X2 [Hippocampus comes]|uniref:THUMP domain-containing protein 1 isoform X2 n=1 Tax=Hippocampus comes TaxID=109280 RepID=UPI00094F082E|nr:PREDICTED: THUMP domain-containing protein 1 isoform X2 [Hippocampus comes]
MSAPQNEFRKRGKKHFGGAQYHAKRWRGSRELEVGMQGILITCNMNQRKCTAEAFNLLSEYADKLYGPEKLEEDAGGCSEEDVEEALKKEVTQLRAYGGSQERRFQALESGANNVIFIRTRNLESDKLVHHILADLHATKKKKTRVILRMLPVTGTCRAFPEDMMRYLSTFLEPWFKKPNCASYQIAFKSRNNNHSKRGDVIKAIATLVGKLNPRNMVNLTQPDLTIILEVIKTVCCVSVVREYTRYKKYNLQEVVKDEEPKKEESNTVTEKAAEAPAGEAEAATKEEGNTVTEKAAEEPATNEEAAMKEEGNTGTEKAADALAGKEDAAKAEEGSTVTEKAAESPADEDQVAKKEEGSNVTEKVAGAPAREEEAAEKGGGNTVSKPAAGSGEVVKREEGDTVTEPAAVGGSEEAKQPGQEDLQEESAMEDDDNKVEGDGE